MEKCLSTGTLTELRRTQTHARGEDGTLKRGMLLPMPRPKRAAIAAGIYRPMPVPYTFCSNYILDKHCESICARDDVELSADGRCASMDLMGEVEELFDTLQKEAVLREPAPGEPFRWQCLGDAFKFTRHTMATLFGGECIPRTSYLLIPSTSDLLLHK